MIQYKVNHKSKEFHVYSISYNLVELKETMKQQNAEGYSIVHVLEKKENKSNIRYAPSGLIQD